MLDFFLMFLDNEDIDGRECLLNINNITLGKKELNI